MLSTSNFHPMVVHFPIALILLGFLAEIISVFYKKEVCFSKFSFYLLLTGMLGAAASVLTGLLFTPELAGETGKLKETHEMFAFITTALALITFSLKFYINIKVRENTHLKWIMLVFYTLTTLSVAITGYFGGNIVYGS